MEFLRETLPDGREWWRIADPAWENPLDPGFAGRRGGRWNPPDSFPVLYLNENMLTARLNLSTFVAHWPYEPEDLRDETGPVLVGCALPHRQIVCDAHTAAGLRAAGLPNTYPLDEDGAPADVTGEPLLFKGDDFVRTDVRAALPANGSADDVDIVVPR